MHHRVASPVLCTELEDNQNAFVLMFVMHLMPEYCATVVVRWQTDFWPLRTGLHVHVRNPKELKIMHYLVVNDNGGSRIGFDSISGPPVTNYRSYPVSANIDFIQPNE